MSVSDRECVGSANVSSPELKAETQSNILFEFKGKVVIIGWGLVAKSFSSLLLKHFGLTPDRVRVIAADDKFKQVAEKQGISHTKLALVPDNYQQVLKPLLAKGDFLLNLSVNVSSLALLELCHELGAFYLDTCIEPWAGDGGYDDPSLSLSQRSNYALREEALALKPNFKGGPTALIGNGANPGLVSFMLKEALVNLAKDLQLKDFQTPKNREEWAKLAKDLNIKTIHIAERDTQVSSIRKKKGEFVNTWSVDGFISEAIFQPCEMGWGTHEKTLPADGKRHEFGCGASIYLTQPGCLTKVRTWTPNEGPFVGFAVTHNESISIADYFTLRDGKGHADYRPTVHYAYSPCDDSILSLNEMLAVNGPHPASQRVMIDDVESGGIDELGLLLMGHEKGAYWYGSKLSVDEARKLAPYNNATSLQVCAGILAGMVHILENPNLGIIEADDLDYARAMEIARPYLGKVVGAYTDWTPMKDRLNLFGNKLDHSDPWQFVNFRVA